MTGSIERASGVDLARQAIMRHLTAIAFLITATVAGSALAGRKAGVTMPDAITVHGQQLVLNGMGLREATIFDIDVYVAGLYVVHPTSNAQQLIAADEVKRLVLRFVRDVGRDDITDAWHEGFAGNATVPLAKLKPLMARLDAWTPSFDDGDTLTFTYVPGEGVTVEVNGKVKGTIADPDFVRSLFSIWLGPNPPTADVKRGLLGSHPNA